MTPPLRLVHFSAPHGRRAADRQLDPGRSHLHLDWDRRELTSPSAGRHRLTVPLHGGPLPVGASQLLTQLLDVQWVFDPVADWSMGSIFARVSPAYRQEVQTLTVDLAPRDPSMPADESQLFEKLTAALSQLERIYDADDCLLAATVFSVRGWPSA